MTAGDRALVTGAGGLVGRALLREFSSPPATLSMASPSWQSRLDPGELRGAAVFHLAARVHESGAGSEADYMADNVAKTSALANAAAAAGARAFVFVSTAKVNGEETRGTPFRASDAPAPEDAYARSKLAAERALGEIAARTGLPVVIVRPPLVYGHGARGNLRALIRLCDSGWPLPFAALDNRRSFVHATDLADLLLRCARDAPAGVRTYLAAHPTPVSTRELVAALRAALGRPARLYGMPSAALETMAALTGQAARMKRLTRSLEVDASQAQRELQWVARVPIGQAVEDLVDAYRSEEQP